MRGKIMFVQIERHNVNDDVLRVEYEDIRTGY